MRFQKRRAVAAIGGVPPLLNRIKSTTPVFCLPLIDKSGTVATDAVGSYNGTYQDSGVAEAVSGSPWSDERIAAPDGVGTVPFWTGSTTHDQSIDMLPGGTGFESCLDWDDCTLMIYAKVYNAGVWTDGAGRDLYRLTTGASGTAGDDRIPSGSFKDVGNNVVVHRCLFNAENSDANGATYSGTDWFCMVVTIDHTSDEIKYYLNNQQMASTADFNTGVLSTSDLTWALLGASGLDGQNSWHGYLAYFTGWNRIITAAERAKVFF